MLLSGTVKRVVCERLFSPIGTSLPRRRPMLPVIVAALLAISASTIVSAHEAPSLNVPSPAVRIIVAQGEVSIPTDAQLESMEERAITTNPLDDSDAPV